MRLTQLHANESVQTPERKLLVALLRRAVFDYFGNRSAEKAAAEEWLFGDSDVRETFTFPWVCQHLDFIPTKILGRLQTIDAKTFHAQRGIVENDADVRELLSAA